MTTRYLGDGLYAKFDGTQIALMVNDPDRPSDAVYVEWPEVWNNLTQFVADAVAEMYGPADDDEPEDEEIGPLTIGNADPDGDDDNRF